MSFEQLTWETIYIPAGDLNLSEIDKKYIQQLCRYGSNTENAALMVVSEFSKQKPDNIAFLKEVYHGGYGIRDNATTITAQYEDDVILITQGKLKKKYSWEYWQTEIEKMLDEGIFADQDEIDNAFNYEIQRIAEMLVYIFRDANPGYEWDFGEKYGYPDMVVLMKEQLETKHSELYNHLIAINNAIESGERPLRFPGLYNIPRMIKAVKELKMPRKQYISKNLYNESPVMYITDYEIERALCYGSGVSGGRDRIRDFFEKNDESKRIQFLKDEYGIGGHSHALSGANHSHEGHDSKGIEFRKGDCSVMLNWSQVSKIIDKLIREGRYI